MSDAIASASEISRCSTCATELAPSALVCPSCHALVHSDVLKRIAAKAEQLEASGKLTEARDAWTRMLRYLPAETEQHAGIVARVSGLNEAIAKQAPTPVATDPSAPRWKRGIASAGAVVLLALGKLKFLLLGLTKASTFFSMFAFFGVYWTAFGWPLALGLVVSIYIHEMGHVAALSRVGIEAGAPLFIPGLGALVRLRQRIDDPVVDARVGLAGPIWGLGAGLAAWGVALVDARRIRGSPSPS